MNKTIPMRTELQLHTHLSDDLSLLTPDKLVKLAAERGCGTVAITDLHSVQAFGEVSRHIHVFGHDLKLIYGISLDGDKPMTILAKNRKGVESLYKLVTAMNGTGQISLPLLSENRRDLLVGSGKGSELAKALDRGEDPGELTEFYDYIALFPNEKPGMNKALYALGKLRKIPVVAVGNCHYADREDEICKAAVESIRGIVPENTTTHLRTTEEMLELFSYLGENVAWETVVDAPNRLAESVESVNIMADPGRYFTLPDARETVAAICREKLPLRYGKDAPAAVRQRLETELAAMTEETASMCLLCHRLVTHLHEKGILTGFRSTVGSLLAAYLLEISDVDPLPAHYRCRHCLHMEFTQAVSGYDLPAKACPCCGETMTGDGHNIPYETFLGLGEEKTVDIDINIPPSGRETALRFLAEELGSHRVAFAGTANKLLRKLAESYLRVYSYENRIAMENARLDALTERLAEAKKQDCRHPAGVVLLPEGETWENITPIRRMERPIGGVDRITCMSFDTVGWFLPKLDLPIYNELERLQKLFAATGRKPEDIDYTDPALCRLIREFNGHGVPEFHTDFSKHLVFESGAENFSDLVRVSGMSHGTGVWKDNGEHLIRDYPFREMIGDRDDVFLTLRKYGVDRETAYGIMTAVRTGQLRKGNRMYEKYRKAMEDAGVPVWYMDSMEKIRYLFPKAHAVHYARIAMCFAWFKVYEPEAFYNVTLKMWGGADYLDYSIRQLGNSYEKLRDAGHERSREREVYALLLETRNRKIPLNLTL